MNNKKIKEQISKLENDLKKIEKQIGQLEILQYSYKIFINKVYGAFATPYSPFCDIDAAASITLTGQACIKEAANIVNDYLKNKYQLTNTFDIYGDTDSVFFIIQPILDKLNKTFLTPEGKISKEAYAIEKEIGEILNTKIKDWAKNSLNSIDSRLEFKREAMCDTAIFIQKKRYILHVLDLEGFPVDKMKYVGVEVQRSDIPKRTKNYIKSIVETIMKTKDFSTTNNVYFDTYEKFKEMPIEDISFPRGLNNFDKYNKASNGMQIGLHTPVHAKAAIYYNYLIDKFGLTSKYEKIKGTTKIKWLYVEKNKYGIDVIGYLDKYPVEFGLKADYNKMFSKIVGAAAERLYTTIGWRVQDPNCQEAVDLFELLS